MPRLVLEQHGLAGDKLLFMPTFPTPVYIRSITVLGSKWLGLQVGDRPVYSFAQLREWAASHGKEWTDEGGELFVEEPIGVDPSKRHWNLTVHLTHERLNIHTIVVTVDYVERLSLLVTPSHPDWVKEVTVSPEKPTVLEFWGPSSSGPVQWHVVSLDQKREHCWLSTPQRSDGSGYQVTVHATYPDRVGVYATEMKVIKVQPDHWKPPTVEELD